MRTSTHSGIPLNNANGHSLEDALRQPVGNGGADDAAADDGDVVVMIEALLQEGRLPVVLQSKTVDDTSVRFQGPEKKD